MKAKIPATNCQPFVDAARAAGCPEDQLRNFIVAKVFLQERQLAASAAARRCDQPDGPTAVGYGGARGGGKSHWLLAQMGADDCQRVPGLKCLLLRKVGKANMEHFEDLRRKLFTNLSHEFSAFRGILTFKNGSRIIAGHFQNEKDIDAYLGLEYDIIGIEEATTLTARKYQDITTCCRTSKPNWRPRIYSTTNPGGVGHAWYRGRFVAPHLSAESKAQSAELKGGPLLKAECKVQSAELKGGLVWRPGQETIFVPARVEDNAFNNPEYRRILENLSGWQRRAWLDGDWDLAAGQFFTTFRREVHVVSDGPAGVTTPQIREEPTPLRPGPNGGLGEAALPCLWDDGRAVEWFAALDYGFAHYTVVLLGCTDGDGNTFVVDEHAERMWLPRRHAMGIREMLARHRVAVDGGLLMVDGLKRRPLELGDLKRVVAGADVFSRQSDGTTIAAQYAREGITLRPANMDRINGWAEILNQLGDPASGVPARLFIHQRCGRLIETLPTLQHDPNRPEDVLKVDADEDGLGGDDAADALRYLVATKSRTITQRKLRGL